MSGNRAFVERWLRLVWEEGDVAAVHEMMAPDAKTVGLDGAELTGPRDFTLFMQMRLEDVRNVKVDIVKFIEDGEWFSAVLEITAISRKTGLPQSVRAMWMARVADGQIVEGVNLLDYFAVFEQLGRLPPRALERLLLGAKAEFVDPDK